MNLLIVTQAVDLDEPVLGFFHRWVEEFAKHCDHIHVICLKEGRHALPQNVSVHSLGKEKGEGGGMVGSGQWTVNRWGRMVRYACRFLSFAWRLRREYDAVFVHMNPEYVVLGGLLWRVLGKRIGLWYVHKSVDFKLRIAALLSCVVFTASPESFRLQTHKLRVVGHGIDTDTFAPREHTQGAEIRIITIGRIAPSKHLTEMLDALDRLHEDAINFSWTIAGAPATSADYVYVETLKERIAARPYASRVHMLGAVRHADIPQLLKHADVFVSLSETGSLDKAVLEAMAAGVPPVTSNPAFASILPSGLFVPAAGPSGIASAIITAAHIDGDDLIRCAREYSLQTLVPRIMDSYE